jgi:hypothetical protein
LTVSHTAMSTLSESEAGFISSNIDLCRNLQCYDVVIVCTGNPSQEAYWQNRLSLGGGVFFPKTTLCLAVHEDWEGGAGNGLGTLYAYKKAVDAAQKQGKDLNEMLANGASVALYHTAGKGTRLAPLPGSENNNKPGVQLPAQAQLSNGERVNCSILEAVIKQTGIYAQSRGGRLSVYWGDQVFIPSIAASYTPTAHADILCKLRPMPTAEEWEAEGLHTYGLIAVNAAGAAAQVEKVTHETATRLLNDGLGDVTNVGTSLGSFSVSAAFLNALMDEYASELEAKKGKLDTDPHFWMPLTLSQTSYVEVMKQKGVSEDESTSHYQRMAAFKAKLSTEKLGYFGAVDVGRNCYWWDYGQLRWYWKNNVLAIASSPEAGMLRKFFGIDPDRKAETDAGEASVDEESVVLNCKFQAGSVQKSIMTNVRAKAVNATNSLMVNVSATKVEANGAILYNVVDDSEGGVVLGEGDVRADIVTASGEKITMLTNLKQDSGKAWKVLLDGNQHTFEDIYKMNLSANIMDAFSKAEELHKQLRQKL